MPAAVAAAGLLIAPALLVWEGAHAVRQARTAAEAASSLTVSINPIEPEPPGAVDLLVSRNAFRDATIFQGHFFAAGSQGVVEYDPGGGIVRRFRTGLELPGAAITAVTAGILAGASEPELLMTTAGDGLLAFDGRRVRQIRPIGTEYRNLIAVLTMSSGRVLLATDKRGLLVYDGETLKTAHPELADVAATVLAGNDGDVWIGTTDRGVWRWRAGAVERIGEENGLPDRRVLSIAVDGPRTYVGTPLGIAELEDGRFVRTLGPDLFASAIAVRRNALVVGTIDGGLAEIPLGARPARGVRPMMAAAPDAIERFVQADGNLYALAQNAIYTVDDRSPALQRVTPEAHGLLTDTNVSALALDGLGRLWVGYFDRGLDILMPDGERQAHVEDSRVFCVNRIVHDPRTNLTAVATANGLVLFDSAGRLRQVLGRAQGLISDHVTDLLLDGDRMTVATPAGLTFVDAAGNRSLYAFQGLVNNHVYALGSSGTQVFAGTLGGASVLDSGIVRANYTSSNSALTHNWITAVARVDDEWFVGTYGGGLFRLDAKGTWSRFADLAARIEINPNAMAVTDAYVVAGSLAKGLLVYDRRSGRWTTYDTGLPSLNVTAVAATANALYVGTDNGIVRMSIERFAHP